MKQNVNYISHHRNVNMKLMELNMSSTHISLYNALFLIWNECHFDTELSINRNDVMKLSKIGSANTYTKCLKELDEKKFLKYKPSYNPLIGSKIDMYRFDKGSDKGTDNGSGKSSSKGSDKGTDKGTDKGCDTLYKLLNKETIKHLNNKTTEEIKNFLNTSFYDFLNGKKKGENENIFHSDIHDCYSKCIKYFPEHLQPNTEKVKNDWLGEIKKLNEIDKIPFEKIVEIVKKTREDDFWSKNFMSILKLRKKNKEGIKYVLVFNEQIKNNYNGAKKGVSSTEVAIDYAKRKAAERNAKRSAGGY